MATRGRRLARRQWLGLPIGMYLHLVLDLSWTRSQTFWWPFLGVGIVLKLVVLWIGGRIFEDAIEAVLDTYRQERAAGERFIDAVKRLGLAWSLDLDVSNSISTSSDGGLPICSAFTVVMLDKAKGAAKARPAINTVNLFISPPACANNRERRHFTSMREADSDVFVRHAGRDHPVDRRLDPLSGTLVDEAWVRIGEAHFDTRGELAVPDDHLHRIARRNAHRQPGEGDRPVERGAERAARDLALAPHHSVR